MVRRKKYLKVRTDRELIEISDSNANEELVKLLSIVGCQPEIYKRQSFQRGKHRNKDA
jgi:hypothetical protein